MLNNKPIVTLISWTNNPLKTIHAMTQNMMGNIITDLSTIKEEDALATIEELAKTNLGGPLENVSFTFQVQNVPRAFTHQMVRTRVGATYSQESMRFVFKGGDLSYSMGPSITEPNQMFAYSEMVKKIHETYKALVDSGVETQDARGILPINTNTNIGVTYSLKTLIHMAEVRLCYQSQAHWKSVVTQMKEEISNKVHPALADLLKMYCDKYGRCGYESIYDRDCPKQETLK